MNLKPNETAEEIVKLVVRRKIECVESQKDGKYRKCNREGLAM